MVEFFIAKKHMLERKKQSFIAIIGIAIGIAVLTVSIGISNGLDNNMIKSILSISPHILINNYGNNIIGYKKVIKELETVKGIKGVSPKIVTQGILKYHNDMGSRMTGVQINGMDLEKAKKLLNLDEKIVHGEILPNKLTNVMIGKELFDALGAKLGEQVEVVSAENKKVRFTIGAVFQTGYMEYDTNLIILPLKTVQIMSETGDTIKAFDVLLDDPYKAPLIAENLYEMDGDHLSYRIRTWGDMNRTLLQSLKLEKTVMIVLFSLLIIIAGFVIGVVLNTLVREKTKDIGILRAVGYSRSSIQKIFLIEGVTLGILGIIIGLIKAGFVIYLVKNNLFDKVLTIYYLTEIPVQLSFKDVGSIVVASFMVILISSIYPARKASKMTPVEALRYE